MLGEHLREATRAALGEHLREEQLASTAACSASTPGERPTGDEHPLPSKHEQPATGEHEHHQLRQQLASSPWLASTRVRDGEESHGHPFSPYCFEWRDKGERERGDGTGEDKTSHLTGVDIYMVGKYLTT